MANRNKPRRNQLAQNSSEAELARGMSFSGKYEERRYISELPNPEDLAKLEALHPGTTERILQQYEKQAAHRRDMEKEIVRGNIRQQNRGPIYGAVLVGIALSCGTYLIAIGRDSGGLATIITALASPVAAFIGGRVMQYVERKNKGRES